MPRRSVDDTTPGVHPTPIRHPHLTPTFNNCPAQFFEWVHTQFSDVPDPAYQEAMLELIEDAKEQRAGKLGQPGERKRAKIE